VLNEFYCVVPSVKKVYRSIDELQADLDPWSASTMNSWCFSKTPMQTFLANGEGEDDRSLRHRTPKPTGQPGVTCQIGFWLIQKIRSH
jgi:hypothetical protein